MKRIVVAVIIIAVAVGAWWGYNRYQQQQEQAAQERAATQVETDDLANVIWASGKLQPVTWAELSPAGSGLTAAIHVQEGEMVKAGDLLVELDNAPAKAQVEIARAAVAEAEAARARLLADATDAQIAAAQAQVAAAEAAVALAAGQMLEAQAAIETAQAQVDIARRQYGELASHPNSNETNAAKARIAIAEAALSQAQAAYNLVRGDPEIGALPQSMLLQQATAGLEAARAESSIMLQGPTSEQLSVAAGQINLAAAQVNAAESRGPGAEAAVKSALAQQAAAQAELDRLLAGATQEEIAMADARVQSALAALTAAEATVRQSQVSAPFAGQIGQINTRLGQMSTPGESLLLLGDIDAMHVETTDLRETDVVRLRLNMPVEVTFDALPGKVFEGVITKIAPVSNTEKGSTNYTVFVDVTDLDPSLRWGMTAFVNISAE